MSLHSKIKANTKSSEGEEEMKEEEEIMKDTAECRGTKTKCLYVTPTEQNM